MPSHHHHHAPPGDNQKTAEAICDKIGVLEKGASMAGRSFTGRQFSDMTESEQEAVRGAGCVWREEGGLFRQCRGGWRV